MCSADQASASLRQVAEMFAELGEQVAAAEVGSAPAGVFEALAQVALKRVDGAASVSVTVHRHGVFRTEASTDIRALHADAIQYELRSGPCVDAIVQDTVYRPDDLLQDQRWPEFGRRAASELGMCSMLSYRLNTDIVDFGGDGDGSGGGVVGGLNIYADHPAAFTGTAVETGLLLATHGALMVAAQKSRREAVQLEQALGNSRDIGVAMGILMATHKITRAQAFDLLRITSQNTNRKLAEIAREVGDTGILPFHTVRSNTAAPHRR
jgi:hypothetical protein